MLISVRVRVCSAEGSSHTCTCSDGWTGPQCDHAPAPVGFEKVASHITGVTAAGLTFIEDALPKGAGLQACVPASLRFTYAPYLWARAHL